MNVREFFNKKNIALLIVCIAIQNYNLAIAYKEKDGPPHPSRQNINLDKIPNAKPKYEQYLDSANPPFYIVDKQKYVVLKTSHNFTQKGIASWYGKKFHGKKTSSGETYDMFAMTAAHKELPIPTYILVTNLDNMKKVIVKINDRGPFVDNRIIDLSYVAAKKLEMIDKGTAKVQLQAINPPNNNLSKNKSAANELKHIYLQIAAFKHGQKAINFTNKIRKMFDYTINTHLDNINNSYIYKILAGPISSIEEIEEIASNIEKRINIKPLMIMR
ncbi:MAG: septal ring lytic transglycosylase RlpA family protein [Legionellales bacterium]|nr:septal ring lytic transglycosylase RlpA family protein [Legionellales bacterium]